MKRTIVAVSLAVWIVGLLVLIFPEVSVVFSTTCYGQEEAEQQTVQPPEINVKGLEALKVSLGLMKEGHTDLEFTTREELLSHLHQCALSGRKDISFSYVEGLAPYIADIDWMTVLVDEAGIQHAEWSNNKVSNFLEFTHLVYFPEYKQHRENATAFPPTFLTMEAIKDFLWACGEQGWSSCVFYYGEALDLYDNTAAFADVIYSAGVLSFDEWHFNPSARRVELKALSYYPNRFRISTTEELQAAFLLCRSRAYKEAAFYLNSDLYRLLTANDFSLLYKTENQAAIGNRNIVRNDSSGYLIYTDISYPAPSFYCVTLQDISLALKAASSTLSDSLTLFMNEELFCSLSESGFDKLISLTAESGIGDRDMVKNESRLWIEYTNIIYYPGVRIFNAVRSGKTGDLTHREKELYNRAQQLVSQAQSQSNTQLDLEMALFDILCMNIRYEANQAPNGREQKRLQDGDTAFGALLNGAADCDGYADAFYLLGNLTGLEVCYKYGDTHPAFQSGEAEGMHMWNLIRLNGSWYTVDVTWGDLENGMPGAFEYCWLNIGADRAALTHIWDQDEGFVSMAKHTDPALFYFTRMGLEFFSLKDAADYVYAQRKAGADIVQILISAGAYTGKESFTKRMQEASRGRGGRYSYATREIGEDCYLTVYWE